MYRFWLFVCYCFLYRPNLFLRAQSWTGLNLYPFPIADSENESLFTFHCSVSPHLHLSTSFLLAFSCHVLSREPHVVARPLVKPRCGLMTRSQALSILALRLTLKVRDRSHYCSHHAGYWTCLATTQWLNVSKLFRAWAISYLFIGNVM